MMVGFTCDICLKSGFASKESLRGHKNRKHKDNKRQLGDGAAGMDLRIYPKTSNEIVNDHLDNNRHLYDDEAFNRLKRKASGNDGAPYKYTKDNLPSDEIPEIPAPQAPQL